MAWFDILGGVAGGLQQGLGQLQQAQQAKQVEARQQEQLKIQQAQDIRAQQAAKRQEEQERLEMFKQMLAGEDPLNVSGQTMSILQQKYADLVPTAIAKNTETGTFQVKMPPAQRAALENAQRQLKDTARYTTLVNTAPEGSLPATEAVAAVRRGGQDASLLVRLVKPSELLAFQKAIYPKEAFQAMQDLDRALRVESARAGRERMKEATLTPQAKLNFATTLQTAADNKVRAAEAVLQKFDTEYGSTPRNPELVAERQGLQQKVDAARQEAETVANRVATFVAQTSDLGGVRPLFPSQPAPAPTVGVAPQAGNPFRR